MLTWQWGNPLLEGFSNQPQKGYIDVEPDAGIPFRRLKFTDIYDICSCSFHLTRTEYLQFINWYRIDLKQGTEPFEMYDCRYGVTRVGRLIGDVPQFASNSKYYKLNVTIAFEPLVTENENYLTVENNIPLLINTDDTMLVNNRLEL